MSKQIQTSLMELSRQLNSGQTAKVLNELKMLQSKNPDNPDILHLLGLAYKKTGDIENATASMLASLKLAYKQPQVHNNLANVFKHTAQFDLAEKHYRIALDLQPDYVDAWKNLGLLLYEQHKSQEAIEVLKHALTLRPQNASVLTILGDVYKEQEDLVNAEKHYLAAIAINSDSITALHNLGLLYKLNDRAGEAIPYYQRALKASPNNIEIMLSYANALFENGDYQKAEMTYLNLLELQNDHIPGHELLNELYWQKDMLDKFGVSYIHALKKEPQNQNLIYSYANSLHAAQRPSETNKVLQTFAQNTNDPRILYLKGKLLADEKNYNAAKSCFEQALASGFSSEIASDLIKLNIIHYNYSEADELLDKFLEVKPTDQLAWALRSLNWRLQGDARFNWLVSDYEFVKPYVLEVPNGYSSMAAFLEELTTVLLEMHNMQKEPLRQTLKLGSQTPGRLLYKRNPVIQTLKESFSLIVQDYIAALPNDPSHPLLGRKSNKFKFSGSWSVKLRPGGFHVNHVHPEGWLSSSFYVSIPASVLNNNDDQGGAIKFGESPLQLGEREAIAKIIIPEPGMLVLFPSYTWHGTIPFESDANEFRLTAPFDVIPQ